ncbi:MAG: hypothetical protein HON53_07670 [Planctomycetaceae bacterium]|jgi:hypothetical protein|nr:hypothetical protein [Planctomycetaceae bacterium]MBT6157327.1 hypothetical protein [Planctomycetaceae bacterium]MBT6487788.1 hypothetical protein [Planctomycetaceae bacterium]MBT6494560.1 hypothetical protein [Planctomycetaceae bacterium]
MAMYDDEFQEREDDSSYENPRPRRAKKGLPVFCMVVFIIDLVFCVLRIGFVALGLINYQNLEGPLLESAMFELITGAAIVLFGIAGNGLMLAKQAWAVALGWLNLGATLGSIGVGIWQASIFLDEMAQNGGEAERIGGYIGAGFSILVRVGIIFTYLFALLKYSSWSARREPETAW